MHLAEKKLCPAYLPHVLIRFSGSGIANSRPFLVTTGTVTVHYTYNCSAMGTGNFIADLETGNQALPGSDDQSIANDLSAGLRPRKSPYAPANSAAVITPASSRFPPVTSTKTTKSSTSHPCP